MFEYEILENKYKISVIILTYAPKNDFVDEISILLTQSIKPYEILIMNTDEKLFYKNLSTDNKDRLNKMIDENNIIIKHIEKKEFDHGKTRNFAACFVNGDYILYMTDDCIPYDNNLLYNLLIGFDDKKVAVSTARQIAKINAKISEKLVREYNYPNITYTRDIYTENKYGIKNYFISNVCSMYDKNIFNGLLGFKENIPLNEDMLYAYKLIHNNYKIYYNCDAKVYHSHNLSYMEQFKRNYLIAKSQKQNKEVFLNLKNLKEGKNMVLYVLKQLLKDFKIFESIDFVFSCLFRYLGFICGKII